MGFGLKLPENKWKLGGWMVDRISWKGFLLFLQPVAGAAVIAAGEMFFCEEYFL
jgi:hypothetical protein